MWHFNLFIAVLLQLQSIIVAASDSQGEIQQAKLVCYYTNWAKDRPDPWAYVSVKLSGRQIH